jgi:hypothetical protein
MTRGGRPVDVEICYWDRSGVQTPRLDLLLSPSSKSFNLSYPSPLVIPTGA